MYLHLRSVYIWVLLEGTCVSPYQAGLGPIEGGLESGGVWGKRMLRRMLLPEEPACGSGRGLHCAVGLSLCT